MISKTSYVFLNLPVYREKQNVKVKQNTKTNSNKFKISVVLFFPFTSSL